MTKNQKIRIIIIFSILFLGSFCLVKNSQAANYYISPTGTDSGNCTIGSPCLTLSYGSQKLTTPGDILYCRGGTYTAIADRVVTYGDGTETNPKTIKNYGSEVPIFQTLGDTGNQWAVWLGNDYWVIDGLQFKPVSTTVVNDTIFYVTGNHNVIKNCYYEGVAAENGTTSVWTANTVIALNEYRIPTVRNGYLYQCTDRTGDFKTAPVTEPTWPTTNGATVVDNHVTWTCRARYSYAKAVIVNGTYNEIAYNTFTKVGLMGDAQGGGYTIALFSGYNAVYHNALSYCGYAHVFVDVSPGGGQLGDSYNEVYSNACSGGQSYCVVTLFDSERTLIQDNTSRDVDVGLGYGKTSYNILGDYDIVRRNTGYNSGTNGRGIGLQVHLKNSHIYNNVFWGNGANGIHAYQDRSQDPNGGENIVLINNVIAHNMELQTWSAYYAEIGDYNTPTDFWADAWNNKMEKNFIVAYKDGAWQDENFGATYAYYMAWGFKSVKWQETPASSGHSTWSNNIRNYCDPKFVDSANGNFTIQTGSCLIDAGRHLTTAVGNGSNSTTLIVADANFFWAGWKIKDSIKVGSNGLVAISSINYTTNTITLASPISWSNGDNVDLAYNGNAPDIGVYESLSSAPDTTPPAAPTGVVVN